MNIQPVNNVSFGIRLKVDKVVRLQKAAQEFLNIAPDGLKASIGTTSSTCSTSTAVGVPLTNTVGTGFDVLGTAFILKPMNVDSYGIVPSTLAKMAPYATPETVESSALHPETAGAIFSTTGWQLHRFARFKNSTTVKNIPS